MDFLKSVAGKIISGAVVLAVVAAAISWWRTDPATRQMLLSGTGRIISWLGIVLIVPWATFFVIGRVGRTDSNAAGAALVASYTVIETVVLMWLFGWKMPNATAWTFLIVGALFAAVYNLFACDWIAEKIE
jgi:hypothetical protein